MSSIIVRVIFPHRDPEPGYGSSKARPIPRKIEVVPPSSQSASSSNRLARFTYVLLL